MKKWLAAHLFDLLILLSVPVVWVQYGNQGGFRLKVMLIVLALDSFLMLLVKDQTYAWAAAPKIAWFNLVVAIAIVVVDVVLLIISWSVIDWVGRLMLVVLVFLTALSARVMIASARIALQRRRKN